MHPISRMTVPPDRFKVTFRLSPKGLGVCLSSILFAAFIVLMPWDSLSASGGFRDIEHYLGRLESITRYGFAGAFDLSNWRRVFLDELLFGKLLQIIAEVAVDSRMALLWISFATAVTFFYFTARTTGIVIAFILLVNPPMIDLLMGQIRSALAFAFMLIALMRTTGLFLFVFTLASAAIHTSMLAVFLLFGYARIASAFALQNDRKKAVLTLFIFLVAGLLVGEFITQSLREMGDRRNLAAMDSRSLLFVAFWGALAVYLTLMTKTKQPFVFEHCFSISILAFAFSLEATGFPAFRFIAMAMPIVFVSVYRLPTKARAVGVASIAAYNIVQFSYWLA